MAKRKRLHRDAQRRCEIAAILGRTWFGTPGFYDWAEKTKCGRAVLERTYAAMLFVGDAELAHSIARRTASITEAGREAKAVAALKEIAGGCHVNE